MEEILAKTRATASKTTRRKTTAKRPPARRGRPRQVELKPVFNRLSSSLAKLKRVEQTKEVKGAIARLNRCLRAIDEICGPDMIIPVQPMR